MRSAFRVRLTNGNDGGVANHPLVWRVTGGGGTLPTTTVTGADGRSAAYWVLGGSGTQTAEVEAPDAGTATLPFSAVITTPHQFLHETFTGELDGGWGPLWLRAGPFVESAGWTGGEGLLQATTNTARMRPLAPDGGVVDLRDPDVTVKVTFDPSTQGVGITARYNGVFVDELEKGLSYTAMWMPGGEGLRVYRGGNRCPSTCASSETALASSTVLPTLTGNVHHLRFRVRQVGETTSSLQVKMWQDGTSEPGPWMLDLTDSDPLLQNPLSNAGVALSLVDTGATAPARFDEFTAGTP